MRTARSPKRPAGLRARVLLVVVAALWAVPPAWAEPGPSLDAPADGSTIALPAGFSVTLPDEGWVRVQISSAATVDAASLACDSGWYHSGFHSSSTWTLPGVIGYSEVECELAPGEYRWRAAYGGPTGSLPSDDEAVWSEASGFAVPAPPPPPPAEPVPAPAEPDYDDLEEALCAEDSGDDPDGGDPGEVEFSADEVEATPEELAIGTPPPAEPETLGTLARLTGDEEAGAGEEGAETEYDMSGATACSTSLIRRWVAVTEFHVALGFDGVFHYEDGRETKTQAAVRFGGGTWRVGGWVTESRNRGARWVWPRRGPFHRRIAAEYLFRKSVRCSRNGCARMWTPYRWTGRLRPGAIRIQTTGWNNPYKFRLPHGHSWTKWQGTNKAMEMAVSIRAVSLRAQAGYSAITRMTWKSTQRCRENWIDPINADAAVASLIYTWSDNC